MTVVEAALLIAQPYAHRGLHRPGGPVENSRAAVAAAIAAGLGVEVDLRLSADGTAMVHHDVTLERVCGDPRRVRDLTVSELRQVHMRGSDETVALASEVVELVDGSVPLLLDLKVGLRRCDRERMADEVARLVAGRDIPVAVVSFDPLMLAAVAQRCPSVSRGQSGGIALSPRFRAMLTPFLHPVDGLWFNALSRPQFLSYNVERLPHRSVTRLRAELPVLGWTIRCRLVLDRIREHVDGMILEGPALDGLSAQPHGLSAQPRPIAC